MVTANRVKFLPEKVLFITSVLQKNTPMEENSIGVRMHRARAHIVCTAPSPPHYFSPKPAILLLPIDDMGWAHWEEVAKLHFAFLLCFAASSTPPSQTTAIFSQAKNKMPHTCIEKYSNVFICFLNKHTAQVTATNSTQTTAKLGRKPSP